MRNKNKIKELVLPTAVVVMIVLATLVTGYAIFTSINAEDANSIVNLPSAKGSWSVAIDTLQDSPIFGAGAGNYLTAFSRYRPIAHNSTDLWNTKFTTANSFYLTTITETGLVGAAAVVFLILALYRRVKEDMKTKKERKVVKWGSKADHNMVSLVVLSALFLFLPADPANIVLLFVLLGLSSKSSEKNSMKLVGGSQDGAMKLTSIIFAIPVIIVFLVVITNASSILAAEYTFKTGLDALVANDGVTTHDTIRKAINKNPRVSRYRATMSQVSLGLANSIASAGDGEVTDQGRQTIAQLVQQSVDEAKAAVAINPTRADNWGLLAGTYNSVARLAEGAADFAVQSYSQAIALDPLNPSTRVALGGLYFAAGEYSQAIRTFELVIAAKPDLANAHFNLAFALKEDGQIDNAIREMTIVLSLVDTESNDFTVATEALDALETSRDELVTESDNLTPPNDGEQILQPPLDLPENSQPPEAVVVGEEEKVNEALPTPTIIP